MSTSRLPTCVVCEPLEGRSHFAASAGLDPKYLFSDAPLRKVLGRNASYYQAVPAPGDRTYLLAERYADHDPMSNALTGYLTIIAITADGKLDSSFGTGGIALTGRITQQHYSFETSGILRLDNAGRLYFADDTRVMRFRANGTTDRTFGNRGAISFASPDQSVGLCDMTTTDNGVLLATTKTHKGVEYFAVQKAEGQKVKTVWSTTRKTGVTDLEAGGMSNPGYQQLQPDNAQFVRSAGALVLARVEDDYATGPYTQGPDDDDPGTVIQVSNLTAQHIVVSRLDSTGRVTDVLRKELNRGDYGDVNLGIEFTLDYFAADNMALSPSGRTLSVQTSVEFLQLDLKTGSIHRFGLPGERFGDHNPRYQLLPDGNIWVRDEQYDETQGFYFEISKYRLDGTLDTSFAKKGTVTVRQSDFVAHVATLYVHQLFFSSSGHLTINASGGGGGIESVTLRRT